MDNLTGLYYIHRVLEAPQKILYFNDMKNVNRLIDIRFYDNVREEIFRKASINISTNVINLVINKTWFDIMDDVKIEKGYEKYKTLYRK